ncbi:ExbD/TolR family protein [Agaribacterium haliotis]|uniref:ExbD/TolR family protein n=1 Tax=Agaribacterium haliotis TaxID=2013869 RepID=UPI000BB58B5A|nr:biopolymer transporter ExbD [Agaribacterium haliotis]
MALKKPVQATDDAELDVTAFLNLMIVLVPVLLLSMSFANVTVLELRLPELTGGQAVSTTAQSKLEVEVKSEGINVYFPEGQLLRQVDALQQGDEHSYDLATLSLVLKAVKQEHPDKKDVVVKLAKNIDYQNIVEIMDAVSSYQDLVVASVVEFELFPDISLGDAQ